LAVNSYHHQAIAQIGTGLTACATAPDGTIDAVSDPGAQFFLGAQWHPETLTHRPEHVALFQSLVAAGDAARPALALVA
jgi:putative glutamine amidotransferase